MSAATVPAMRSIDARRAAAELVSDADYPAVCRDWTIAKSERATVREIRLRSERCCTPPPQSSHRGYLEMLEEIARTR